MRDRSAALAAARAAIDKTPQYQGKSDSDAYNPGNVQTPLQQSAPPPMSSNPFEQAIMNAAQAQNIQGQQDQGTHFQAPPMDQNQFMLMKLYHMLSGISYELYGDPEKWQEEHLEAFMEKIKNCIKRSKSVNSQKMKKLLKKK